jgi:predicted metal-dependent hydrolase
MGDMRRVEYGTHVIEFRVERRDRRTLEIAVEPDATVVVAAPLDAEVAKIDAKVRKRAAWIMRQQRYFEAFLPRTPARRYLAGETHLYLGRHYRLKVVRGDRQSVKAVRGFLVVERPADDTEDDLRRLVEQWYIGRARVKFAERLEVTVARFSPPERYRPRGLIVRQLQRRWGSMSPTGRLMLNLRLIEAPMDCIDYVITHELCHLAEPHHGPGFFDLLTSVMPDWARRKDRLERTMA